MIKFTAGLDEAGMGPIAGPATFCVVLLDDEIELSGVRDSKKLTDDQKYAAACTVAGQAQYYTTVVGHVHDIDVRGIGQVWQTLMLRMIKYVLCRYSVNRIVVDGNRKIVAARDVPGLEYMVKADDKVLAVSAASVLAKCEQLEYMEQLHLMYPEYGFGGPKGHHGYGVESHAVAIEKHGAIQGVHRRQYAETLAKHRGFELRWRKP